MEGETSIFALWSKAVFPLLQNGFPYKCRPYSRKVYVDGLKETVGVVPLIEEHNSS